jgi:lysophospholipase L1-like esterase
MNSPRTMVAAAALLVLFSIAQPAVSLAQSPVPVGLVDNPCPPPVPPPPEMAAMLDSMLNPSKPPPAPAAANPGGAAAQAYAKAQAEQRSRDWANLCRYRSENAALKSGEARIVFMGDSITEFWLPADRSFFGNGVVNRGIGGQTSPQMVLRFYADVVALRPKAVHIMTGTNDLAGNTGPSTLQDYQNNVMAMTDMARAHGIKVLLASIPPADRFPWKPELMPAKRIIEINAWLKRFAAEEKLTFIDYHSALSTAAGALRPEFGHDGVHPHRGGYAVMKPLAQKAMAEVLNE